MSAPDDPIAKVMTITRDEFVASLRRLDPVAHLDASGEACATIAGAQTRLRFEVLPRRRLGGVLSLPQARVTLVIDTDDAARRAAALRAFDIAFQRGGG